MSLIKVKRKTRSYLISAICWWTTHFQTTGSQGGALERLRGGPLGKSEDCVLRQSTKTINTSYTKICRRHRNGTVAMTPVLFCIHKTVFQSYRSASLILAKPPPSKLCQSQISSKQGQVIYGNVSISELTPAGTHEHAHNFLYLTLKFYTQALRHTRVGCTVVLGNPFQKKCNNLLVDS